MVEIVVASLKAKSKAGAGKKASVGERRVRDSNGRIKTVRTLDAGSHTFGDDLLYVFGRNVAKARRDNKLVNRPADDVGRKG